MGNLVQQPFLEPPRLLPLTTIRDLFEWFRFNLVEADLRDRRGFRVRFLRTDFVHLIKLTNKYGDEPKNHKQAIEDIERGRIQFVEGRYDSQRARELGWARNLVCDHWRIVDNWQPLGRGYPGEAYLRDFGTPADPIYRVLICEVIGRVRRPVTIFPRERFSARELAAVIWP